MRNQIYLDNAATTPLDPEVLREMMPYLTECFGNPSSIHGTGREAGRALMAARRRTAGALGASPREILFTSGGSESDNQAVKGTAFALRERGNHLITSRVEHHAVLEACRWLEKQGFSVTYLPVDAMGRVDPEAVRRAIRPETVLISVMMANNEIGTIQPVREIASIAREAGVLFHTDAVQAVGSLRVDVEELGVDLLSLSAHKFHGPKGAGALYVRQGVRLDPWIHGGAQERSLRAGTENLPGIVGLAAALERANQDREARSERICALRDLLIGGVLERVPGARLNGDPRDRLPGNAHFTFEGLDSEALLLRLDLEGIACSGGSACTAGTTEPSHVLQALGQSPETAKGGLRFSLSGENTAEEIRRVLEILPGLVRDLRRC